MRIFRYEGLLFTFFPVSLNFKKEDKTSAKIANLATVVQDEDCQVQMEDFVPLGFRLLRFDVSLDRPVESVFVMFLVNH